MIQDDGRSLQVLFEHQSGSDLPTVRPALVSPGRWEYHPMVRQELREVASDLLRQCLAVNAVEGFVQVQTQERRVRHGWCGPRPAPSTDSEKLSYVRDGLRRRD